MALGRTWVLTQVRYELQKTQIHLNNHEGHMWVKHASLGSRGISRFTNSPI